MRSSLLAVALVVLPAPLVACASTARGPSWPKPADRELDGGESLAPRQAGSVAAVTSEASDDDPKPAAATVKDTLATPDAVKPTTTPTVPAASEDSLLLDDITIEIED